MRERESETRVVPGFAVHEKTCLYEQAEVGMSSVPLMLLLEVLPLGVLLHLRLQVLRLQPHARYFSITIDVEFIEEFL